MNRKTHLYNNTAHNTLPPQESVDSLHKGICKLTAEMDALHVDALIRVNQHLNKTVLHSR